MRLLLIPACLAALLAACADGVSVSYKHIPVRGVPGHADYAAAQAPTPVVIRNAEFPSPTVVAALHRNNPRQHLIFSTEPPASIESGYRLLLTFDGRPTGGPQACREPVAAGAPAATAPRDPARSSTSVYGVFCLGPTLLSEAMASGPRLDSAADSRLPRLLGDLLSALMPTNDPFEGSADRCFKCN